VFAAFQETYLRLNGGGWETDREAVATVTRSAFARAYGDLFSTSSAEAMKVQVKQQLARAEQTARVQLRLDRFQKVDVPRITVVPAASLRPIFPLGQITNAEELQQWLEAVRSAAQAELDQGHRISL